VFPIEATFHAVKSNANARAFADLLIHTNVPCHILSFSEPELTSKNNLIFVQQFTNFNGLFKGFQFPLAGSPHCGKLQKINPMLSGSLVTTTWRVLRLRMDETACRYGSFEYIKQAVADSRQGVVLQLGG
jgi:hypothetical protein